MAKPNTKPTVPAPVVEAARALSDVLAQRNLDPAIEKLRQALLKALEEPPTPDPAPAATGRET